MTRKTVANLIGRKKSTPKWIAIGIDISMSSIAGAAIGYDATLRQIKGPVWSMLRWPSNYDYLLRVKEAAEAEKFLLDRLMPGLKFFVSSVSDVYIALEEPWPMGIVKRAQSGWLKQQAQISGAFLGGLVRYGYQNVFEINYQSWLNVIRKQTGQTIPANKESKWKVKQWAIEHYGMPDLPDLIQHGKLGKIPRPEGSKAKAVQPEDVYDALGIMEYMRIECEAQLQ